MILDSPIISGSLTQQAGQTAEIPRYTAVSSSFLAASASFDARIDSIESTTASLSPRINALESFTASANATYVNVSGDSMSGDLTITGSLVVTDRITAQEFHTEYVSSSVVFQSGSTKFGNSGDDTHSFTGSVKIDGTVMASNLEGIFSSSAQITGSLGNYYIVSGTITQTTWDNIASKPVGIVSGASQIVPLLPEGVVSGSSQLTASLDSHYIVSGTITQTTWDNIASKPGGIVSGAAQVTESLDLRYRLVGDDITFAELTYKPTLISGSSQLDGTTINNLTTTASGSFSGSFQGDGSSLRGLAAGAKFHTQTIAASTWTFVHNLSTQYPNVTVYDSNNNIVLPQSITATNVDTLVLEFGSPVAGYATAGIGGIIEVNGRTIKQYFTSSLSWRFEHNIGDRFVSIQTYDGGYEKIIPQTIALTDATSSVITFPEATEGWAIGTIGGDLPSISSSYGGYVLQVSDSAPYTASWTAAANVTVTNALTASHLNSFSQSLIPATSGAYDLGSIDKPFRHIYVGTGSIYLVNPEGNITNTISAQTIVTTDTLGSGSINLTNSLPAGTVSGSSQVVGILSSLNSFTASNFTTNAFTSSATARLNALETTSASVDTLNTAQNARLTSLEEKTGSLATTGSNTFIGTQTITGSLYVSSNLIVQGSSSLQNITASAVDIGTNKIILNVNNPAIRYAGISVYDSGSTSGTGSLWWDSVNNYWLYEHPADSGAPYNSAILISGPKNTGNLGEELGLVSNYIVKAVGGDHISSSAIYDDGTTIGLKSNTEVSGTFKVTNASTFNANVSASVGLTIGSINSGNDAVLKLATNASASPRSITYRAATAAISIDDTSGTALMTVLNGGNVGIGTTNPFAILTTQSPNIGAIGLGIVGRASDDYGLITFRKNDASTTVLEIGGNTANGLFFNNYVNAPTTFATNAVERVRITASGIVAIGTTSPYSGAKLQVKTATNINLALQTGTADSSGIKINAFNDAADTNIPLEINGSVLYLKTGESTKVTVTSGGAIGIGTTSVTYSNYKLQARVASDRNLAIGNQGTDVSIEAYNDLVSANVPLRIYGNSTYLLGGNVGIGTTSTGYKLDVYTAGGTSAIRINADSGQNTQLRLEEAGTVKFATTYVPSDSSVRMYFAGSGSDLLNFKGGGIGIGTTNPGGYKLYAYGDVAMSGNNFYQGGTSTVCIAGSISGNQAASWTINCSSQSSLRITCAMNHYGYIPSYGCARMSMVANGPVFTEVNISDTATGNGGSWSFTQIDSTRISINKNAGSYGGGGLYFIEIVGNNPWY